MTNAEKTIKNLSSKLTLLPVWRALHSHAQAIASQQMADWFKTDTQRYARLSRRLHTPAGEILLDFSKSRLTTDTLPLLIQLAEARDVSTKMAELFTGEVVNITEKRPALHTALRDSKSTALRVNGVDVLKEIRATLQRMETFTDTVRAQQWYGATGQPIRDIVNVGIGGSDLGPRMTTHALQAYATDALRCHFISDVDAVQLQTVLQAIDPARTLFIISSKSFTTPETLLNANTIRTWLAEKLQLSPDKLAPHFVAVTAQVARAESFGIPAAQIFPIWEWVGGRFSIWSAIGLPLALMIGMTRFREFLGGAHAMDQHFRYTPFIDNLPVIMALIGIWHINFHGYYSHALAPYTSRLQYFRDYIQQLDMESNGKRVMSDGMLVNYITGPTIIGEQGCDSQHSFFQALHQGPMPIPVDFILVAKNEVDKAHKEMQIASALSQARALMQGKLAKAVYDESIAQGLTEGQAVFLIRHKVQPGNRPSNVLFMPELTPAALGQLLALYEHKIFVQGVIWDINSFDQWGVELGKQILPQVLTGLQQGGDMTELDISTRALITYYREHNKD